MKTAVIILNWNGAEMLRRYLPSVVAHSATDDTTVIVADNGSDDDSLQVVRTEFPSVRLIVLDRNYGFAEGYNRAIAQVEATYIVLLNSDVRVTAHWLEPLVSYMDTHPHTAACQPKIRSEKEPERFEYAGACGGYIDALGYPFCRGRILDTVETDRGQYDSTQQVFWATGAALLVRAEAYRKAGGLDGDFFAHMEEIDLCWRLKARGHDIVCIPRSVVYHVGGATLAKSNPRKTYLNFRNNLLMLYKNLPDKQLHRVMRVRCLLDFAAMAQAFAAGKWGDAKAICHARQDYTRLKPQFAAKRQANLRLTRQTKWTGRLKGSLLWQYYARGRKTFDRLPHDKM